MRFSAVLSGLLILAPATMAFSQDDESGAAAQGGGQTQEAVTEADETAPTAEEIDTSEPSGAEAAPCDPSAGGAEDVEGDAGEEREAAQEGCAPDDTGSPEENVDPLQSETEGN